MAQVLKSITQLCFNNQNFFITASDFSVFYFIDASDYNGQSVNKDRQKFANSDLEMGGIKQMNFESNERDPELPLDLNELKGLRSQGFA